jgi:hypothetical protein
LKQRVNRCGLLCQRPISIAESTIVVLKLVASCRWNYGLDKLSAILEMKTLQRQPAIHATACSSLQTVLSVQCTPSFIISHHLSLLSTLLPYGFRTKHTTPHTRRRTPGWPLSAESTKQRDLLSNSLAICRPTPEQLLLLALRAIRQTTTHVSPLTLYWSSQGSSDLPSPKHQALPPAASPVVSQNPLPKPCQ